MHDDAYNSQAIEKGTLKDIQVRPVSAPERPQWDRLMREHHYLGFRALVGESLRYVAIHEGRWLALLGWGAAALKCTVRDQWIGWTDALKLRRLFLVANNMRFLILPDIRIPNLASRTLALNLRRLSDDWRTAYGHPIRLAETFVDPTRYRGTCYRAAGWLFLGHTNGFGRHNRKYTRHGRIKSVFVRPLVPDAANTLADPGSQEEMSRKMTSMRLSYDDADRLQKALLRIPDSRMPRGIRHHRLAILSISVCAVLCGASSFDAIAQWGKACSQNMLRRLRCRKNPSTGRYEAPSEPAIRRFLQSVDASAVDRAIMEWASVIMGVDAAVAIDGKTLRGARTQGGRQVQLLSAFLHHEAAILAQEEVPAGTNEIKVVKPLLDPVPLEGAVVTGDAIHAQKDTAIYLVEDKKADYALTVKDNQPSLKQSIEDLGQVDFPPSAPNHG